MFYFGATFVVLAAVISALFELLDREEGFEHPELRVVRERAQALELFVQLYQRLSPENVS